VKFHSANQGFVEFHFDSTGYLSEIGSQMLFQGINSYFITTFILRFLCLYKICFMPAVDKYMLLLNAHVCDLLVLLLYFCELTYICFIPTADHASLQM
jgi:hypothetical protein